MLRSRFLQVVLSLFRESNEAHVSTQSPPPPAHAWVPGANAHQERPNRSQTPSRERPQASDRELNSMTTWRFGGECPWITTSPDHHVNRFDSPRGPQIQRRIAAPVSPRVHSRSGKRTTRGYSVHDAAWPGEHTRAGSAWDRGVAKTGRRGRAQPREAALARSVPPGLVAGRAAAGRSHARRGRHRAAGSDRRAVRGARG